MTLSVYDTITENTTLIMVDGFYGSLRGVKRLKGVLIIGL